MKITQGAQQKVHEFIRCQNDLFYYAENYVKISLPGGDIVPTLYDPQKSFLENLLINHYCVLLKTRQTGGSTAAQIYCSWALTFYKNVVVGMVSKKGEEATDFSRHVMTIINNQPDWMRPIFIKSTEQTFILDNGGTFFASAVNLSNPEGLFRSKAITIAVIDEAAHIPNIDVAYTGFAPTLFKSHKVAEAEGIPYALMIISTPNRTVGIGKWYFDTWKQALDGRSIFKASKIYWKDIPEFANDPKWYKTQCDLLNNDPGKIQQELEMQFLGSSDNWLPLTIVERLHKSIRPPKTVMHFQGGDLWQWAPLDIEKFYLIGIDTAPESGGDKSTIEVFDYIDFKQVAEFSGNLEVFEFCKVLKTVCKLFPNNLLIPENNSYGNQVVETLLHSDEYYNVFVPKTPAMNRPIKVKRTKILYGLNTNSKTRPLMMDALFTYIVENPEIIKSERLVLELIGLVEKVSGTRTRVEADKGTYDDLCLATAFLCYVKKYDPPMGIMADPRAAGITANIMETIDMNDEDPVPVGLDDPEKIRLPTNREGITLAHMNKLVHQHLKEKLIAQNGEKAPRGKIDTLQLFGLNRFEQNIKR